MSFDNTIKLVKLQRAVLVQAIQTIDDHFYARKQPKEILELRHRLDLILNSDHWADKRIKEEHQRLYNYYEKDPI